MYKIINIVPLTFFFIGKYSFLRGMIFISKGNRTQISH